LESDSSDQQVYHIGNDDEITVDTLTRAIGTIMGYNGPYETAPTYPGSVLRRCPDITKAKHDFAYTPKVLLEEGLRKTVAWYTAFFDAGNTILIGGFKPPESLKYKKIRY
jgi:nucleoside-diphosphate-sugar epimerase